jgi:multidrug transporter EmrE-like cation transporter
MSPTLKAIPLILVGVALNAFAQIAIKKAVSAAGMEWSFGPLVRLFLNPWMLTCLACYAVSVVLWAGAMHLVEVNFAYPFLALGFVAVALLSRLMLGEVVPPLRWVALGIIVLGIVLQAFTGKPSTAKDGLSSHGVSRAGR